MAKRKRKYVTKSVRLGEAILAEINKGSYAVGTMLPSEAKLGRIYDASRVTVRRTLDSLAEQGVVERIPHRGVMVRGGTGGQRSLPSVSRGASAVVVQERQLVLASLLVTEPDEGMVLIQEGIQDYVRAHGLSLQFLSPNAGCANPFDLLNQVEALGVDGVIILPYPDSNHVGVLSDLQKRGFPAVCVEKRSDKINLPSVAPDNATGMYRAVNHLIQTYKQPVHYLSMTPDHKTDHDRHQGYVRAMEDARFHGEVASHTHYHAMKSSDPRYWQVSESWLRGYEVAIKLLDQTEPPLSIACVKDYFAWGVYKAAEERGLQVGRDLMVVGFDDLTISQLLDPPLTTVHQPIRDKGFQAARLLHQLIVDGREQLVNLCLPVELVIRDSA